MRHILCWRLCLSLAFLSCATQVPAHDRSTAGAPELGSEVRVALIGDSTVASYLHPPADRPDLTGWGQVLGEFFDERVTVNNYAVSGRSSKSFLREGRWRPVLDSKPHFIFIQFGHNDQPGKGDRATNPDGDFRDNLRRYIRESREVNARPVLVTPVARRTFSGGKPVTSLVPYVEAMHAVARETNTPLVDLHAASFALYEKLGDAGSADLSPASTDRSHFSRKGALAVASLVAAQIPEQVPALRGYLKQDSASGNNDASSVLAPGGKPVLLQDHGAGEGPVWHPELGLLTSGDGNIMRRSRNGEVSVYRENSGSNGLLFDQQGRLVICEPVRRRVSRLESNGRLTILAERFDGMRFNQPNDLTIDSRGRIYFSDPCYGDRSHMEMRDRDGRFVEGVYRIDLNGVVSRIITHEVDRPNGLVITPDDRSLFVADNNNAVGGARKLWRFNLREDGTPDFASQKLIYDWKATRGPDGMKLDREGRLFVAAGLNRPNPPAETQDQPTAGVYVFSPDGKLLEFIPIPRDECTNCAFGGDDLKTLFVTAGGTLWSVPVRVPGKPVWPR